MSTPSAPTRRVLVVEDDGDIRALIAAALRNVGFLVTELSTGLDLYSEMAGWLFEGNYEPDLIISDVKLPGFTGLEALRSLKGAEIAVPFIVISAYADDEMRRDAQRLGAAAVLSKPFDIGALLAAATRCARCGEDRD